ncbi:DASH family cryptochrome [Allomuricauda sp. d1]|uniref:DASH family cryptochrome n=1 Tax=Allomuricauda sp. d1 TaxID=3136725 RepID=UPI0031CFA214
MNSLIWFNNDLRISDCETVKKACEGKKVIAVYCFDPRFFETGPFGFKRTEKFRAKFLIESVHNLRKNLEKHNITLLVFHDRPENVLPEIVKTYQIDTIFLQQEWTRDERKIIDAVNDAVKATVSNAVTFEETDDQFLFHPEDIPYPSFENIPDVFTQFRRKCEKQCKVRPVVSEIPPFAKENKVENGTEIPSLEQLGLEDVERDERTAFPFSGGEDAAQNRLQDYIWETKKIASYKKTRNGLIGKDYSSKLSAWLANGSISPRTVYWEVKQFEKEVQKNDSTYWLIFELIWRDYFKYVSLKHGDKIFWQSGILNKEYHWKDEDSAKQKWISGTTKEPFVNANMVEIGQTGWMSNRGRQNVASYWAKHLEQDWRVGAAYFESMLIDYDVHSNWGNWMYNSGVGNDPRDRKFNIQRQADMYDKKGTYQDLWLQQTLF